MYVLYGTDLMQVCTRAQVRLQVQPLASYSMQVQVRVRALSRMRVN